MKKLNGQKLADIIANFVGSWKFIIIQSVILTIWVIINGTRLVDFDPYPFILLNLFLSFQAAYATPMILMSSNVQTEKDRKKASRDLAIDEETNKIIKLLAQDLSVDLQALKDHELSKKQHEELKNKMVDLETKLDAILKKVL
jgi:uncharacterized membrane protein